MWNAFALEYGFFFLKVFGIFPLKVNIHHLQPNSCILLGIYQEKLVHVYVGDTYEKVKIVQLMTGATRCLPNQWNSQRTCMERSKGDSKKQHCEHILAMQY